MKGILLTALIAILVVGLTLTVIVFGLNFRETEQDYKYDVTENLNDYELAENVMEQYFYYYKTHGIKTRLSDYRLRKISLCDDRVNKEYIGEKDGFVFLVTFDVKPFFGDLFSDWYAGNGINTENGWCVGKSVYYMITVENNQHVLDCIGTMY